MFLYISDLVMALNPCLAERILQVKLLVVFVCVCGVSPIHASNTKMNLFTTAKMDKSASIYINLWINIFYFYQ